MTLKVALWFVPRVTGGLIPAKLNPDPLTVICEMVRALLPTLVSVSERVLLLPVATVPKLRLEGFAASWPGVTPVPDSGTFKEFASELMAILPFTLPLDIGAKLTFKFALWPTPSVNGSVKPDTLNPDPVVFTAEIVTFAVPTLVRVSARVCELPTRTLPKLMLAGAAAS